MKIAFFLAVAGISASSVSIYGQSPTPLSQLIAEARRNNTGLRAAEHTWRSATHMREQVTALPDPQFTLQEFSVGSPKPFAGFRNSNFAYIAIGASQELPYPGKRRLKGQAADAAANVQQAQSGVLQASLVEQIKTSYFRLAYRQQVLALLESSRSILGQIIDSEITRYGAGEGSQVEVLKAQLERTKMVREITMHREEMAHIQADLKQLTHRQQDSADIVADDLTPGVLRYRLRELLDFVRRQNPKVHLEARFIEKQTAELRSAERQGKPDFTVGYMYQRTGIDFPAYYMLTVGLILPRRSRVRAEVAEAAESAASAQDHADAVLQQQLADVQKEYATATSTAELLAEYREGLIPQGEAAFRAGLAGYESNRQPLDSVLASFNEVLALKRESLQTLLDHELALARLEELTGVTRR
jgi:outer membrane protein, heavy metal efflux system